MNPIPMGLLRTLLWSHSLAVPFSGSALRNALRSCKKDTDSAFFTPRRRGRPAISPVGPMKNAWRLSAIWLPSSGAKLRMGLPLQVEYWPLDRLIPYAANARTHSASQVAEIAGSIRAFGFSNPILVGTDGDMIAGHGRLAAARQLRMTVVPVIVLHGLTDLQRRSLILADNRIGLNAGWDLKML